MFSDRIVSLKQAYSTVRSSDGFMRTRDSDTLIESLPKSISNKLGSQERCLATCDRNLELENTLSRNIGGKIHRPLEELLMSKTTEIFRHKVEKATIDSKDKPKTPYDWIASLRRPRNYEGTRLLFINAGNKFNPKQIVVKDLGKETIEYIRKPNQQVIIKDSEERLKYKTMRTNRSDDRFSSLQIKGTNLLNEEMNQTKLLKGRKIIFLKDNESTLVIDNTNYAK